MGLETSRLPLPLLQRGKVRDVYGVDEDRILLVATDRISAFDVVMREAIPGKGMVLTQLTAWWLRQLDGRIRHHMISSDAREICREVPALRQHADMLAGRTMLCMRAHVFPVECVLRGYISGSAWKEYSASGTLAGEPLPAGLSESMQFAAPVFSPATKAIEGHDENITVRVMASRIGHVATAELERLTRVVYEFGAGVARERGIIIADTKLEFGYLGRDPSAEGEFDCGRVILVDEVLTPDSSRFWPVERYLAGQPQPSFDKQPLRDYLVNERTAGRWNGEFPPPPLPQEIVSATSERYADVYRRLTLAAPTSEQ